VAAAGGSAYHNLTHIRQTIEDLSVSCGRKLDVHVADASEHMGLISLQGPNSRDILAKLTKADLSNAAFPFSTHKVIEVAGHKVSNYDNLCKNVPHGDPNVYY
jgi:sarcosine dehydrogenase